MAVPNNAPTLGFKQGFDVDTSGIYDGDGTTYGSITRVPDGTNGIFSLDGSDFALAGFDTSGPYTKFDGYRSEFVDGLTAEVKVYIDMNWAAGSGFDYSVATNDSAGVNHRDFFFHVAQDASSGQMLVNADYGTLFTPATDLDTLGDSVQITQSGWYTLQHVFHDVAGVLSVTLNMLDDQGDVVFSKTLSNPADDIASMGGNRYGWFTAIDVAGGLAVDDYSLGNFTGSATELIDNDVNEGNVTTTVDGVIPFLDADTADTHTANISGTTSDYLGNLAVSMTDNGAGDGEGSVSWEYTVSDAELDVLGEGEVVEQTYTISVSDGNGNTTSQNVVITLTGAEDAPTQSASVTTSADEGDASFGVSLIDGINDPDLSDTLSVINVTYNLDGGGATGTAPTGFSRSGTTLTVDPSNSVFRSMHDGDSHTLIVSYDVTDGNGGSVAQTANIVINGQSDAPLGTDNSVTASEDGSYAFDISDFGFSDPSEGDTFVAVTIATLPASGSLTIGNVAVTVGESISVTDIGNGLLVYTPDPDTHDGSPGSLPANFTFKVQDDGDTSDGGANVDVLANLMTLHVTSVNDAPTGSPGLSSNTVDPLERATTLTADIGTVADTADGGIDYIVGYHWYRDGVDVTTTVGNTYTLSRPDVNHTITVAVEYVDNDGFTNLSDQSTVSVGLVGYWYDTLYGATGGNDSLVGGLANDSLVGLGGNDTLDGGAGNDTMVGGTGNDTYYVDSAGDVVTELAAGGTGDRLYTSVTYNFSNAIEIITLTGTADIDAIAPSDNTTNNTITGNSGKNDIEGYGGNDTLYGMGGDDTIDGGAGNDSMIGGDGNDSMIGGLGNDQLDGGTGNDTMDGGVGSDQYVVDSNGDLINEAAGTGVDKIVVNAALGAAFNMTTQAAQVEQVVLNGTWNNSVIGNDLNNTMTGNNGANALSGGIGNDSLIGLGGDDTLDGGTGKDTMVGGAGNDTYYVDQSTDVVTEAAGAGIDTVNSSVTYTMALNVDVLVLTGTANLNGTGNALNNTMTGTTGDNLLTGLTGNDTINGNDGNDTINGGAGSDVLTGGVGSDKFIYTNVTESSSATLHDTITDFISGQDKIDLLAIDANTAVSGNQAFTTVVVGGAFSATSSFTAPAQLYLDSVNHILYGNIDADKTPELVIYLTGVSSVTATDFVL